MPVDYVADAVFELSHGPVDRCRTFNLVAGRQATTVGRLIELSADRFARREPTVIPPTLFKTVVYPALRRRGSVGRGLERSKEFFPYFSMDVTYRNEEARGRLEPAGHQGSADRGLLRPAARLRAGGGMGTAPRHARAGRRPGGCRCVARVTADRTSRVRPRGAGWSVAHGAFTTCNKGWVEECRSGEARDTFGLTERVRTSLGMYVISNVVRAKDGGAPS